MVGSSWLLAVSGQPTENVSIFDPASPPAESIRSLFLLVLVIVGVIFLLVEGILVYSIFRFRQRANDPNEPPQVYGSTPIEIAWTAAPALVVFLLVLILARTEFEVRVPVKAPEPGDNALHVTVIGHQWWWEYSYDYYDGRKLTSYSMPVPPLGASMASLMATPQAPAPLLALAPLLAGADYRVITANELHVPVGTAGTPRPVYLTLKTADVIHSFWVPRLAGKMDLIPGRTNHLWFQTTEKGLYVGQCAEFCGTQHASMLLRVNVDSPEDFQRWLENEQKPAVDNPSVREGRDLFLSQTCISCHRVRGTIARGTFGPDLTHLKSRETLASGVLKNNRANLQQWVDNPQEIKSGCLMAAFKLSDRQVKQIVDYLMTLE